jgi:hypothetical protein
MLTFFRVLEQEAALASAFVIKATLETTAMNVPQDIMSLTEMTKS